MTSFGILIPSHISKEERISSLFECLQSLLNQTVHCPIALSISFETKALQANFQTQWSAFQHPYIPRIHISERQQKTAQMRHIQLTLQEVSWDYILFCDDDDTYVPERVEVFLASIEHGIQSEITTKQFVGSYEMLNNQFHTTLFHEYWCYCVKKTIIQRFFKRLEALDSSRIDYVFCDVLFANFLRTLPDAYFFVTIPAKLYNYEKNSHSQIAQIHHQNTVKKAAADAQEGTADFSVFLQSIHDALRQEMSIIKDNIFVCITQFRMSYLEILQQHILRLKYPYKQYIDPDLLNIFEKEYENISVLVDALRIETT